MPINFGTMLLGGSMDYLAGREANKANRENANALIAAQRENQERGFQAQTGSTPFQETTRTPEGGFARTEVGGPSAAAARARLTAGDPGRADEINRLTRDFSFTLPTLSGARDIISRDRALQQGQFDKGLGDIVTANQRQFGGISNTAQTPAAIDAISRFTQANRFGGEQDALNLFAKTKASDIGNLQQQILANQLQVPAPGFETGPLPGTTVANLVAQTPPPDQQPNYEDVLPWSIVGDMAKQAGTAELDRINSLAYQQAVKTYADRLRGDVTSASGGILGAPPSA